MLSYVHRFGVYKSQKERQVGYAWVKKVNIHSVCKRVRKGRHEIGVHENQTDRCGFDLQQSQKGKHSKQVFPFFMGWGKGSSKLCKVLQLSYPCLHPTIQTMFWHVLICFTGLNSELCLAQISCPSKAKVCPVI